MRLFQKSVKIPHYFPILRKLGENFYHIRSSFSQSFMRIEQELWIFMSGQFLYVSRFFYSDFMLLFSLKE